MLDINQLPNISFHNNIESHFRVFAGPGAGKTTWLVNYLKKVLRESKRLELTRKIACITHTNVAAEEIISRLSYDGNRFDISTIHSFLYRNVIKPFGHLIIKKEDGSPLFNFDLLDGVNEHFPHYEKIQRWKTDIETLNDKDYNYFSFRGNSSKLINKLSRLDYFLNDNDVELGFRQGEDFAIPSKNGEMWLYKEKYWQEGIMHYEDVLYFSFLILKKSSSALSFIRCKFPYIFIDEFQDTTELQTWLIKKIAALETKVGVIGDLAQSIYKFAGAKREDFENFDIDDIKSFKLEKNYRSTGKIINFLNSLREDIKQEMTAETIEGQPIIVLIGGVEKAKKWLNENSLNDTYILAHRNEDVEMINNLESSNNEYTLQLLYDKDSSIIRVKAIQAILTGYRLYKKKRLKEAINEVLKPLILANLKNNHLTKLALREIAIQIIQNLNNSITRDQSLYDYYSNLYLFLSEKYKINIGARITLGKIKAFYKSIKVESILPNIKVDTKTDDKIRTIHSSKGTEFNNVLVYFKNKNQFNYYVFEAHTRLHASSDDARIYYVAFSRARRQILINIPDYDETLLRKIKEFELLHHIL